MSEGCTPSSRSIHQVSCWWLEPLDQDPSTRCHARRVFPQFQIHPPGVMLVAGTPRSRSIHQVSCWWGEPLGLVGGYTPVRSHVFWGTTPWLMTEDVPRCGQTNGKHNLPSHYRVWVVKCVRGPTDSTWNKKRKTQHKRMKMKKKKN